MDWWRCISIRLELNIKLSLNDNMYENLVKTILNEYDGFIQPLILPSKETNGTGTCNSSLFVEGEKIHLIMRHVEYTLSLIHI